MEMEKERKKKKNYKRKKLKRKKRRPRGMREKKKKRKIIVAEQLSTAKHPWNLAHEMPRLSGRNKFISEATLRPYSSLMKIRPLQSRVVWHSMAPKPPASYPLCSSKVFASVIW